MDCTWCDESKANEDVKDCYWVMPDGRRSVKILQVPAVCCPNCGLYVSESINNKVEEQLAIGDLSHFADQFTYEELLQAPVKNLFPYK